MSLLLKRMWIQVSADRKRLGTLGVLVLVGLLLWARVLVVSKPPRTAAADDDANNSAQKQPTTDTQQSEQGENADEFVTRTIELADNPRRDPFVISTDHFPEADLNEDLDKENKSGSETSDNSIGREARIKARVAKAVKELRLEAVLTGTPMAVISGETYRQGEVVPVGEEGKFRLTLARIDKRSVILEYKDEQYELKMNKPGPS